MRFSTVCFFRFGFSKTNQFVGFQAFQYINAVFCLKSFKLKSGETFSLI